MKNPKGFVASSSIPSIILITLLSLILAPGVEATPLFKVYPLADDYFQKVYLVNQHNKQYYLTISCRQRDMLSISISEHRQFQQAPRFNIWGNTDDIPKMGLDTYTFLRHCKAQVNVNSSNFLEIKRDDSSEPFITLNNVTFGNLHNTFRIQDSSVKWGLGERFQQKFRVTDGKWTLWNRDKPWKIDRGQSGLSDQTYGFQPLYLARNKESKLHHLLYFKNTFGLLVEVTKDGSDLFYHSIGGDMHFLIIIGRQDPEEVLEQYHEYIGPSHIPPFWSMGYHQCRWGYKSADELDEVVQKFKENDLPIDVIWSDLEYMDQKMIFTVNPHTHGGGRLNKIIKTHEVRFVPLIDAGVSLKDSTAINMGKELDVFLKQPRNNREDYVAEVWPGQVHFVDFHHPNAFSFWKNQLKRLYELVEFSGIWLDMNEPSNFRGNQPTVEPFRIQQNEGINQMTINVDIPHYTTSKTPLYHREEHTYYGHMIIVPTYEFFKELDRRPFIISRSNSVGSGHFGGHWTGDNVASWDFLRLSISGNFLFQIFGMQMVGADICGFYRNTTEELCSRWMQVGSFYPFSRNHNELESRSQEPYAFGKTLLETSRESLKTRYALLKHMYSVMVIKKGKGSFFRPISFEFPLDESCYEQEYLETEFLIGKSLLVTPIVYEGQNKRSVYFPGKGESWYNFKIDIKTGRAKVDNLSLFEGGSKANISNPLPNAPPTYLRGGFGLLLNQPQNRAAKLPSNFHLLAALKQGKSSTQILAIEDYNKQSHLSVCIEEGCTYFLVLKKNDGNSFTLSWSFQGRKDIRQQIQIDSIVAVEGSDKWTYEKVLTLSEADGSKQFEMQKQ